jgi:hypothetical protein
MEGRIIAESGFDGPPADFVGTRSSSKLNEEKNNEHGKFTD